jgi:hypothetical protein
MRYLEFKLLPTLEQNFCPNCGAKKDSVFESQKSNEAKVSLFECGSATDFYSVNGEPYLKISWGCSYIQRYKELCEELVSNCSSWTKEIWRFEERLNNLKQHIR